MSKPERTRSIEERLTALEVRSNQLSRLLGAVGEASRIARDEGKAARKHVEEVLALLKEIRAEMQKGGD